MAHHSLGAARSGDSAAPVSPPRRLRREVMSWGGHTGFDPSRRELETARKALDHIVHLRSGDDERRTEADRFPDGASDHPVVLTPFVTVRGYPAGRVELGFRRLVGDQLHGPDEADAAHLAYEWVIGELTEAGLHMRADLFCVGDEVSLLDDFQVLDPNRRRHRMTARGESVAESAERLGAVSHALVDLVAHQHGGKRHVG